MKNRINNFAIRQDGCGLRASRPFLANLLRVALLLIALGIYRQWNHSGPDIGLIFVRERNLAAATAIYLLSAFGFLGCGALIAVAFRKPRQRI